MNYKKAFLKVISKKNIYDLLKLRKEKIKEISWIEVELLSRIK